MNYRKPLENIHAALAHARYELHDKFPWWPKDLLLNELDVHCFAQCWSSTSCGFGGVGGQAFTTADTVVVTNEQRSAAVYIAGRFAYAINRPGKIFYEDLASHSMKGYRDDWNQYGDA